MNISKYTFLLSFIIIATFAVIIAQSFRPGEIPNGFINNCANCHVSSGGGGPRNAFGTTVGNEFLSSPGASGHVVWNASLASLDSDGDGFTNGEELQDPTGVWTSGSIGNPSLVTNPGDPNSHPVATSVDRIDNSLIPDKFTLEQNYPNPFNPSTVIKFSVAEQSNVSLIIFNSLGQMVEELLNENLAAGNYNINWRAVNLSSGVYYYSLSASNYREIKKMILVK